jgi:hypothetical protein
VVWFTVVGLSVAALDRLKAIAAIISRYLFIVIPF